MVKAATKSGLSARTPLGALRAGRPLGLLTGGLPPPPSRNAYIFPSPAYVARPAAPLGGLRPADQGRRQR